MAESLIISAASSAITSAISSVINSLATLASNEISSLREVPVKVQSLQIKLRAIQSYLKDAENRPCTSHLTENWLREIRRVTYQAQNVIERILWLQWHRNRARGFTSAFSRYSHIPGYLKSLHEIGQEIDRINSTIPEISDIINYLSVVNLGETSTMVDQFEDQQFHDPRSTIHVNDEDEVVGFDEEIMEIIKELLDLTYKPLKVISLVGMGGIGKTTLAKKVFNHSDVRQHFDIVTSVIVSKQYNALNLQKEILKAAIQIKKEDLEKMDETEEREKRKKLEETLKDLEKMDEEEVRKRLEDSLKERRYLIMIDDIWTIKSWDEIIPHNFPHMNNGSRIMLTTRNLGVAKCQNFRYFIHKLKLLDDEKSWELLKKKAFPPYLMVSDPIRNDLESLRTQLVEKCRGLPLALIVLGGYLSKHLDYQIWCRMAEAIDWNEAGNEINISEILALSYHDLSDNLKPAFLYITTFPEDFIIESSDLIYLWIAEGFISPSQKYQLETTGQKYLEELDERCLIRVVERCRAQGSISRLMMHDVLHDWGMERAKEGGFFDVINDPFQCTTSNSHISLRTLLGFELPNKNISFHDLNSLRAIHIIRSEGLTNKFIKIIKIMIFLRHICLRECGRIYFPSSIGELNNLQTLHCQHSSIMSLPSSLWEISTLRHVYLDEIRCLWNGPKKGSGKNLQTFVITDYFRGNLSEKTMGWMYTGMDGVVAAVEEMKQIVQLKLNSLFHQLPTNLLSKISGLHCLKVLELQKQITGLTSISAFPQNILKLVLRCDDLVEDPMPVLEKLSKLVELHLRNGMLLKRNMQINGMLLKSMHCSVNGFPRLKYLTLSFFAHLEDWEVEVGAMPSLCELTLEDCFVLKKFPESLMEHDQLKKVWLIRLPHLSKVDYNKLEERGCEVFIEH
jgi:NB-ARC domain/Rx N-terminal domain